MSDRESMEATNMSHIIILHFPEATFNPTYPKYLHLDIISIKVEIFHTPFFSQSLQRPLRISLYGTSVWISSHSNVQQPQWPALGAAGKNDGQKQPARLRPQLVAWHRLPAWLANGFWT